MFNNLNKHCTPTSPSSPRKWLKNSALAAILGVSALVTPSCNNDSKNPVSKQPTEVVENDDRNKEWFDNFIDKNGDSIEIIDYAELNGDTAIIGEKNGETCFIYNGKTIDTGKEYYLTVENNWIFCISAYYKNDCRISYGYVNGMKVLPESVGGQREDGSFLGGSYFNTTSDGKWTYFAESGKDGIDSYITINHNGDIAGENLKDLLCIDEYTYTYTGASGGKFKLDLNTRCSTYLNEDSSGDTYPTDYGDSTKNY